MTDEERTRLVQGYIDHHAKRFVWGPDNVLREQDVNFWAWEQMDQVVRDDPDTAWGLILEVLRATDDEFTLSCLAAGALEDLVRLHGPKVVDKIEREASANAKFKELLCGVWRSSTPEVWARIAALQDQES
jgi:hypothetical protein